MARLMIFTVVGLLLLIFSLSIIIVWYSSIYSPYKTDDTNIHSTIRPSRIENLPIIVLHNTTSFPAHDDGQQLLVQSQFTRDQESQQQLQQQLNRQTRTLHRKVNRRAIYNKYANVITTTATTNEEDEDYLSDISPRIVGGHRTKEGNYPYYVFPAGGIFLCGGTLIYEDIVLTAAHCYKAFADTEGVFIGGTLVDGTHSDYVLIDTIYPHPNYIPGYEYNDIMIIKLASPSTAETIPLNYKFEVYDASTMKATPEQQQEETVNYDEFKDDGKSASVGASASVSTNTILEQSGVIIGFGRTFEDDADSSFYLLAANISIVSYESCVEFYGPNLYNATVICAIGTVPIPVDTSSSSSSSSSSAITGKTRGKVVDEVVAADACQGDSGGPLLMMSEATTSSRRTVSSDYGQNLRNSTPSSGSTTELEQIGVVSFGSGCGHMGQPAVYTKIGAYKYWIQNTICQLSNNPPSYCNQLQTEPLEKALIDENDVTSVQLANFILQYTPTSPSSSSSNNRRPVSTPVQTPSDEVNESSAANAPTSLSSPIPPSIEQLLEAVIMIPSNTPPTTSTAQDARSGSLEQPTLSVPSNPVETNNVTTQVRAANRDKVVQPKVRKQQPRRKRRKKKQQQVIPGTTRTSKDRIQNRRKMKKKKDGSKGAVSTSATSTKTVLSKKISKATAPAQVSVSVTTATLLVLSKKQNKANTSVQQASSNTTQAQKRRYYDIRNKNTKSKKKVNIPN